MAGAIIGVGFGAGAGLTMHNSVGVLIALGFVGYALAFGLPWVIIRGPRVLTPLRSRAGSWTATAAYAVIADAVSRPKGMLPTGELLGKVVLAPHSTTWLPNASSTKTRGASEVTWGEEYTPYVRRLGGYGQVHLALVAEGKPAVDLWLHFAGRMQLP